MAVLGRFYRMLTRKKHMDEDELLADTKLKRTLGLIDLTALGVGSTLGVGVYVLAGSVSKTVAGPAVVISFLIAAIASTFAGLCYAEFAARVPKAGSAYVYSYVSVGEFVAFIIGWNLILEYVVGSASVVRALSGYIDNLFGGVMAEAFENWLPMDVSFLSPYPDFFSFGLSIVFAAIVAFGVQESTNFNNIFTTINIGVVLYVIICGLFQVDIKNWQIPPEDVPPGYGNGGFAPYGISGIISGAASCFYGFVGFDCVATTGEEAKNPQRNIPIAIVISLAIIFLGYFGVSTVLTMMWPYYDQNPDAPLPYVFQAIGWDVAYWIVTIGALFGLCASLMGALFPLPRVMYAMAKDGIIFNFLGEIHPKFQTPILGTMLAGVLTGFLSALFDLQQLVDMMSIGTLLAYSIVAACVMLLRYQPGDVREVHLASRLSKSSSFWRQLINLDRIQSPSQLSADIVTYGVLIFVFLSLGTGAVITFAIKELSNGEGWAIALVVIMAVLTVVNVIIIGLQPSSKQELFFKVPLVPFIPALSIFVNLYLMLALDPATWIRFAGWMAVGFLIYFGYGVWHSIEKVVPSRTSKNHHGINNEGFEIDDVKHS